jgi:hypothetical protein
MHSGYVAGVVLFCVFLQRGSAVPTNCADFFTDDDTRVCGPNERMEMVDYQNYELGISLCNCVTCDGSCSDECSPGKETSGNSCETCALMDDKFKNATGNGACTARRIFFQFQFTYPHACQAGEQWDGLLTDPTTDRFCYACPVGKYKNAKQTADGNFLTRNNEKCNPCDDLSCSSTQYQTCNRTTGETACVECTTCGDGFDPKNETCTGYINRECVGMFSPVRSLF